MLPKMDTEEKPTFVQFTLELRYICVQLCYTRRMSSAQCLVFPPFRLDLSNACLWEGEQEIRLRPKTFAVLRYLVEHPGRVVSKADLLQAVWAETAVSDGVLRGCISELRKALHDSAQTPRFLETIPRWGWRFIEKLRVSDHMRSDPESLPPGHSFPVIVGREAELRQLYAWLQKARRGERQTVFVTGEPGIGKTTVVEAFVDSLRADTDVWLARGQCLEQYGVGEAYLPILDAVGRLCREPGRTSLISLLDRYAPNWLIQLPWLINESGLETLQQKIQGTTPERMLRELAEFVEALAQDVTLVLVLEDLHWSDYATLDVLSFLAQRREPARVFVIGTYRPVEIEERGHPLKGMKQELQLHRQCADLPLGLLTQAAATEYLATRLPDHRLINRLGQGLYQRTEGNPLFMLNVVDAWAEQGSLTQLDRAEKEGELSNLESTVEELLGGVPDNLRQMIEKQIDRLSRQERQILEVASLAGMEFCAAAVAAGLETSLVQVERRCAQLARRGQFVCSIGQEEWPDGTLSERYVFRHALYQQVWSERVPTGWRMQLHRQIGERKERGYGPQASDRAAELAVHFEDGRDGERALVYLKHAADKAVKQSAHHEAIRHLTKGLELIQTLPSTPEQARQELDVRITLGVALIAVKGYAAVEVEQAFTRALELCRHIGETPQIVPALSGLLGVALMQAKVAEAHALSVQCLCIAQRVQEPKLLCEAHATLGVTSFIQGAFGDARNHLKQGMRYYDPLHYRDQAVLHDPMINYESYQAWTLWSLGYPDQAITKMQDTLELAQRLSQPHGVAYASHFAALLYLLQGEKQLVQDLADRLVALADEHTFPMWLAWGTFYHGWVLAEQEQWEDGIACMRRSQAANQTMRAESGHPYRQGVLARAYAQSGQVEEGLALVHEALTAAQGSGEYFYEAELYRLKGEVIFDAECGMMSAEWKRKSLKGKENKAKSVPYFFDADTCFQQALEISRRQNARSLELRAALSLSRLRQKQGQRKEAHQVLSEVYSWFSEGFGTRDLRDAKGLLEELA